MDVIFNELECKSIHQMARWFEIGQCHITRTQFLEQMNILDQQYEPLMKIMQQYGVISNVSSADGIYADMFSPTSDALIISRKIENIQKKIIEPPDIVEQIIKRFRRKPITAGIIILFLILAFLIPMVNGLLELLQKFGILSFK